MIENVEDSLKDMTPKLIGETWRKYPTETSKQKVTYGLFECQYCKKEFEAMTKDIKRGYTKSCGCLKLLPAHLTHGLTNIPEHKIWFGIKRRCYNQKEKSYEKNRG